MMFAQPRIRISGLVIILSLVSMLHGCAGTTPPPTKEANLVVIEKIEPQEADGKTEVVVEGTGPLLQYTSSSLSEPLRLVVDIMDADISKFKDKIVVNKGAISDITPSQVDNIARLEIGLAQMVDAKVYASGGKLMVELIKPVETVKIEPEVITAPSATQAQAPSPTVVSAREPKPEVLDQEKGTATVVTSVKATAGKAGVKVVITGNGTIRPNTFMVEAKKLVIDVPDAISKVRPTVIPVRKGGLDKVRIGQHSGPEKKVRVVLDLTKNMEYTATPQGNTVIISMSEAATKTAVQDTQEVKPVQERAVQTASEASPVAEKEIAAAPIDTAPAATSAAAVSGKASVPPPAQKTEETRQEPRLASPESMVLGTSKFKGKKISLDLQDADLITVMRLFAEVANLNIILAPDVKGKVTVRMVKIPWDQAMDIILRMNGLGYVLEDDILRIASTTELTREAKEQLESKEAKKKAEDLVTRLVAINYTDAAALETTLKKSLSPRGETVVDVRTNTIIIKDIQRNVNDALALIKVLDRVTPQVMIEAKIVEATLTFSRDIGVQWGASYKAGAATGNPTGLAFPNTIGITGSPTAGVGPSGVGNYFVNLPAQTTQGAGGAIGFTFGSLSKAFNLDLVLSAMEGSGEGKVISSPRVSALDNKVAKIKQGVKIPYLSTVNNTTTIMWNDADLSLTVTPHVTPDNKISLKILATKNAPDYTIVVNGSPAIRTNEAETEILLADGETAVIGGILILDRGTTSSKVPFFGDIPLIGWLFRQSSINEEKRELLIFVKPNIVKQEAL